MIIFLSVCLNICFGGSKELSHRCSSFEYPQHMFWLRNKKTNFQLRTLIWVPGILCQEKIFWYLLHMYKIILKAYMWPYLVELVILIFVWFVFAGRQRERNGSVVKCLSEPHQHHCVVSLSMTHISLLSTGSTLEDPSRHK